MEYLVGVLSKAATSGRKKKMSLDLTSSLVCLFYRSRGPPGYFTLVTRPHLSHAIVVGLHAQSMNVAFLTTKLWSELVL